MFNSLSLEDINSQLHVWDLTTFGAPEYLTSARFDHVNSIQCPPSSSHVLLGLESGEIKTYDLACLRRSQYAVPNLWRLYQATLRERGVPTFVRQMSLSQPCIDQVLHPRDMNQIFVAYSDGVILSIMTDKSTVRAYELVLPPGAPGGSNYGGDDILTYRRPPVTCLSIHPCGHFFAVGHADGSIAFWAVEDDTAPLTVFTFDEDNVHQVKPEKLQETGRDHQANYPQTISIREPIIKLAWSGNSNSPDPRGGETTLTVLGGLDPTRGGDVTVLWFPAFQPPEPPAGHDKVEPGELNPHFRSAMAESLVPIDLAEYDLEEEIQDFLIIPKESPFHAGGYDPYGILFLVGNKRNERVIYAHSFPPARTLDLGMTHSEGLRSPASSLAEDFEQGSSRQPYHNLRLPFQLASSGSGIIGGRLVTVENTNYERICEAGKSAAPDTHTLRLEGGKAFADRDKHDEIRLTKYQPHRILITHTRDRHVHLFDVSAQSLVGAEQEPLKKYFPEALPGLTVELKSVWSELVGRGKRTGPEPHVQEVQMAFEALELATVLSNGDVVVHRYDSQNSPAIGVQGNEITLLVSAPLDRDSNMHPYFVLQGEGKVEACSISDIGFLAVSYSSGSVVVADMRGPTVVHRRTSEDLKGKHRLSALHLHEGIDVATALNWTVSSVEDDGVLKVRLIISRRSGDAELVTLQTTKGSGSPWGVAGEIIDFRGVSDPLPEGSFVLDSKTGKNRGATGSLFALSYHGELCPSPSIFITVGHKGARSYADITGERIGKADWGIRGGNAVAAQIVGRMSSRALVVITDKEEALAFSLPHLESITRFKLLPLDPGPISIDQSGDFVSFSPSASSGSVGRITYGTFFDIRRAYGYPEVDLAIQACKLPQPQPVPMGPPSLVGTWLNFTQTMSGDQFDTLLGGPDRPLLEVTQKPGAAATTASGYGAGIAAGASGLAASAASAQTSLYNKMASALSERGQLLNGLEESFNSLEQGSRSMAAQAKKLAAQQTAKSWFGF